MERALASGDVEAAKIAFVRGLWIDPSDDKTKEEFRMHMGMLYSKVGRSAEAQSNFVEALRINPQSVTAAVYAARAYAL